MLAKLKTFSLVGIEALPVEVEVDVSPSGLPKQVLVGLPEAAVKESTHRVERAMVNSGFQRPQSRIVVNLAPADLPKDAASFDLPIALGTLIGSGQVASEKLAEYAIVGELALDGTTRPTKGALSMAMAAKALDGTRRQEPPRADRAGRKRGGSGRRGRRLRSSPSPASPRPSAFSPGKSRSSRRLRGWTTCSASFPPTTSISPTFADRRWPSGRSSSPPPADTIC